MSEPRVIPEEKRLPWVSPGNWSGEFGGLTKRELFAAMALQGAIASGQLRGPSECVSYAIQCADTLLKELP